MIKLRIQGLPDEMEQVLKILNQEFRILEESSQYPNRNSEYVRVYMDIDVKKKE